MLSEIRKNRIKKLENIRQKGINPYPSKVAKFSFLNDVVKDFKKLFSKKSKIAVVGRIILLRNLGGLIFVKLYDGTGKMQLMLKKDDLKEAFDFFRDNIDLGDFIYASGTLFLTKTKEKTLLVNKYEILSKALLPLPEKWHGLKDLEERSRQRYLDLIVNQDSKDKFIKRFELIKIIREVLNKEGFLEVETPILQSLAGGALAKPFKSKANALDMEVFLRIAPELYLKRLLIGGFNKIYEIGKCFRNEGIDKDHNPEFTMVEGYIAYWDYEKLMIFIEKILKEIIKKINKRTTINFEGKRINSGGKWKKETFNNVLKKYANVDLEKESQENLYKKLVNAGFTINKLATKETIADEIFKKICRPKIIEPTFIVGQPRDLSPLAKLSKDNPQIAERFQLIIGGLELVNAYSELNDPLEQNLRFCEHSEKKKENIEGDFHCFDNDYIKALEYGMPPAAGFGIGIDRLAMLLTDTHNVRDIILFPLMRPE